MKDYIINEDTKEVIRSNKNQIYNMTYDLTYVKNIESKLNKCPGCGSNVKDKVGTVFCEYCGTIIVNADGKWHMSQKECLKQINK